MSDAADGGYRPYPAYKNSGVEWLGEVPEHWEVKRLKTIAAINPEALGENTSPDLSLEYIDISNVDSVEGVLEKQQYVFETAPSRARRIVRHGDVIVSTVRTYLRAIAEIENPEPNLVVSTGFAVIRPHTSLYSRFAGYSLRAPYFVERVVAESVGVSYPAINASEIACIGIAFPPLPEQHAIAAFLDHKTAEIDTLIAAKERLIALLREKRAALITSAVTKGLDPDVAMKDSGVEWLGEVPEGWEIKRAKFIFQRVQRPVREEDEVVTAFRDGAVTLRSNRRTEGFTFSIQEIGYQGIRKGDLVVHAMDGFAGAIGVSDSDGKATPVYTVLRPLNEGLVNNNYYGYLLRDLALAGFVNALAKGIRERSTEFRYNEIKELWLPVLPYAEQTQVVNFVEREKQKLDSLVSTIQQAIDYLKEYRTALISAAVTGKIDVRNL